MSFSDLRKEYNLIMVAEQHGVDLKGAGRKKWGVCPFPQHVHSKHPTPSFSIYEYNRELRFKCHGHCGAMGDVIDFMGYMHITGYDPRNIFQKDQAGRLLVNGQIQTAPYMAVEKRTLLPEFAWMDYTLIADNARAYLRGRGIADAVIDECRFGSASYLKEEHGRREIIRRPVDRLISIPTFHAGSLIGVKLRILRTGNNYKYFNQPGSRAGLWQHDRVYLVSDPFLIAKGELCGAVMLSAGFTACAVTSGERGTTVRMEMFPAIRTALCMGRKVYVGDNDKTGRESGPKQADLLNAVIQYPPELYKDWDEWYLKDRGECLRLTNQWLEVAARER